MVVAVVPDPRSADAREDVASVAGDAAQRGDDGRGVRREPMPAAERG